MSQNILTNRANFEYKLRIYAKVVNLSKYFFPFINKLKYDINCDDIIKLNVLNTIISSEHMWNRQNKMTTTHDWANEPYILRTIDEKIDQVIIDMQINNIPDIILTKILEHFNFIPDENSL